MTHTSKAKTGLEQPDGRGYIMSLGTAEERRLNFQHSLVIRRVCDGKLVYSPEVTLQPGDKVLDSGAGTDIYLMELAETVSADIRLVGIDPIDNLFPSAETLPDNVSFQRFSTTALPAEWTASYKFVHQRLLLAAFTKDDWLAALQQMHRVLVPGGHVQLLEIAKAFPEAPATSRFVELYRATFQHNNKVARIAEQLPMMLKDAGFMNIQHAMVDVPIGLSGGEDGISFAHNSYAVRLAQKDAALKLGLVDEDEFTALLDAMCREWDETPGLTISWMVVWAQKAGD